MNQPELGKKLAEIRLKKNLTQEELVDICNVSVRTIQRIESGDVTPRISTIKILLAALEVDFEEFKNEVRPVHISDSNKLKWIHVAWIAGMIYLLMTPFEIFAEFTRYATDDAYLKEAFLSPFDFQISTLAYIAIRVISLISLCIMLGGFFQVARIFDNYLLRIGSLLMIASFLIIVIMDIGAVSMTSDLVMDTSMLVVGSIITGAGSLVFGVGLFRLQDSMGRVALFAGIFEIVIGLCFLLIFLFFLGLILIIPANILEIILLYRAYEFLLKEQHS